MTIYHIALTPILIILLFISAILMSFEKFFTVSIITLEHGYSTLIVYSLYDTFKREYNYKVIPMKTIKPIKVKVAEIQNRENVK